MFSAHDHQIGEEEAMMIQSTESHYLIYENNAESTDKGFSWAFINFKSEKHLNNLQTTFFLSKHIYFWISPLFRTSFNNNSINTDIYFYKSKLIIFMVR